MIRRYRASIAIVAGPLALMPAAACSILQTRPMSTAPADFGDGDPLPIDGPDGPDEAPTALAVELLKAHNRERAAAKLPPLTLNARLSAAAAVQAKDMADHGKMSHAGSDGSTPFQRIEAQKYRYQSAGENVAFGQKSVDEVMTGWMNSPHHKENILGKYTELGVARALDADGTPYWCADFGKPWPKVAPKAASADVRKAINAARAEADKGPLAPSDVLAAAAETHAREMADRKDVRGESDAKSAIQKVADADKSGSFSALTEWAASGAGEVGEIVSRWAGDEAQRKILLGEYDRIGVGHAEAADGTPYWSIILGRSRTP